MMFETIENWALHAYADDELTDAEKLDVERILQRDPEARQSLERIQRQKTALRNAYDAVLDETPPARLLAATNARPNSLLGLAAWRNVAAAGLVALVVGAGAGWFAHQTGGAMAETLADKAANTYKVYATDESHAVEITDSEQLEHFLAKRIGATFSIPDLTPQGYSLVGGRLLNEGERAAGLIIYEDANKQRLAIYLAANPEENETGMTVKEKGNLVTCFWAEKDLVYALAGQQKRGDMLILAAAAHVGFDKDG